MSRINRYLSMFDDVNAHEATKYVIKEQITFAVSRLKKDDGIVWYLRLFKYALIKEYSLDGAEKWLKRFEGKYQGSLHRCPNLVTLKSEMGHYTDLDIANINSFHYQWKDFPVVIMKFKEFEEDWQEKQSRIVPEYGSKIIAFEDGSAWFDLNRSGCKIEAEAMGHCGNGGGSGKQTVLSYRTPVEGEQGKWTPHLTFILDGCNGELGEMKARFNEKPEAIFHDKIVALLKLDIIKRVVGGGYMAHKNFSLSDLETEQQESLASTKHLLFHPYTLSKLKSCTNEKLTECISQYFEENENGQFILVKGDNVKELAKDLGLKDLERYADALIDGFENWCSGDYIDESGIETILDGLAKGEQKEKNIIAKLKAYLTNNVDPEELEEYDLDDASDIIKAMNQNDDCKAILRYVTNDGNQSGAESELWEAYIRLTDQSGISEGVEINFENGSLEEWKLVGSAEDVMTILQTSYDDEYCFDEDELPQDIQGDVQEIICSGNFYDIKTKDLEVPYYGFSGWCENSAKESLFNLIGELETVEESDVSQAA